MKCPWRSWHWFNVGVHHWTRRGVFSDGAILIEVDALQFLIRLIHWKTLSILSTCSYVIHFIDWLHVLVQKSAIVGSILRHPCPHSVFFQLFPVSSEHPRQQAAAHRKSATPTPSSEWPLFFFFFFFLCGAAAQSASSWKTLTSPRLSIFSLAFPVFFCPEKKLHVDTSPSCSSSPAWPALVFDSVLRSLAYTNRGGKCQQDILVGL